MTSQTIWGGTARAPAVSTMRIPVDINSSSGPGYLTVGDLSTFVLGTSTATIGTIANGSLLIGTVSAGFTLANLTAGANVTITNGAGSITISATGSPLTTKGDLWGFDTVNNRIPVGTNGQILTADSTQTLGVKWATGGGGSGTVNSGTAGQLAYYASTGTAVSGDANANISSGTLTLGQIASVNGAITLSGSASGAVSLLTQNAAGTWNFNLPITAGSAGQVLTSQGGGSNVMTWATPAGGGNITGPVSSTTNAIARYTDASGTLLSNSGILIDGSNNVSGMATLATGAITITSPSATSLTIGPNGVTTPILQIDSSTASAVVGIKITGGASGGGTAIAVQGGGTNESLTIATKGAGALNLNSAGTTGTLAFQINGSSRGSISASTFFITPSTSATASTNRFKYTTAANTTLTGGAEFTQIYWDMTNGGSSSNQHASNTAITTQRDFRIDGMLHSFASSGGVITDAAALALQPSQAGTNATITNAHGILIPTFAHTGTVTNGYGLSVSAPSGAGSNFAAQFTGIVLHIGDIKLTTAGNGIYIKEGTNASMGTATLSSGTVTVSTTKVTANSRIFLAANGGTLTNIGSPYVSARSAGTSFTISSTNALDTAVVDWVILEPA